MPGEGTMTSETSTLSAAEKAELRRQKILAKKNARIAYAAGDRSSLPSTAPSEPIQATNSLQPSDNTPIAEAPRANLPAVPPEVTTRPNTQTNTPSLVAILSNTLFRGALLGITAIVFAFSVCTGVIEGWPVSAVEVFAWAELCLSLPRIMFSAQDLLKQSRNGRLTNVLWLLSCAQGLYGGVNELIFDFSAFMLCFLCTWNVLTR